MKIGKKTGIALEGGGAKGAYQIGVLKAILELNVDYDLVTGTSIGAVNGIAFVLKDYSKFFEIWSNMNFSYGGNNKESIEFSISNIDKIEEEYFKGNGTDPEGIITMYKENINEKLIRNSDVSYGLTTYCLTDKEPLNLFIDEIPTGLLHEYIFASCNLPVFLPRSINGKYYLDGGIFNLLPVNMLADKGCDTIITVRLRTEKYDFSSYKNINIIDIAPDEYLCNTLEASPERIRWMIKKGYRDGINILRSKLS